MEHPHDVDCVKTIMIGCKKYMTELCRDGMNRSTAETSVNKVKMRGSGGGSQQVEI